MASRRITAVFSLVLITCFAASALVVRRVDRLRANVTLEDAIFIPSPKALKRLSLGYNALLADIYWTRAVQYFGSKHHEKARRYDLLAPLLEVTTDLDPHLLVAYQFGSIFLSQQPPEGAGQPKDAVALVEKGVRENPDQWQLYYNLGWIEYSELKDYAAASQAFSRGSQVKGAAPGLKVLAAAIAQHGGDAQTARYLWTQIYNTTEDKNIRANAVKRLQALKVDEDIANLESVMAAYKQATGHYPANWAELQATGWRGLIVDPTGRPYRIRPDGRIEVQDPDELPFITRGLPPDRMPSPLLPSNQEQMKAIQRAEESDNKPSGAAAPVSKK